MLYKCSIGVRLPFPSSQAPVTKEGNIDLATHHISSGTLFFWVGESGSKRMEFFVKEMDGGLSSSSSSCPTGSVLPMLFLFVRFRRVDVKMPRQALAALGRRRGNV
mmetsp:Transcript_359/g.685  ORF Transcript_359/g.685 Transcript_359/m.685 type:complete len:106 (+) Transcript_359:363-680(+)